MRIASIITPHRCKFYVIASLVIGAVAVTLWRIHIENSKVSNDVVHVDVAKSYPGVDLSDPQPSYEMFKYVVDTGGDVHTRDVALVWIDNEVIRGQSLTKEREDYFFTMLNKNGHSSWDFEYRRWIFNSTFNALHLGKRQEDFSRLLVKLVLKDLDHTMQLYALQHIGSQRRAMTLDGELASEVKTILENILTTPNSEVAGTVIALLAEWNGGKSPADADVIAQAIKIAASDSLTVDVRVTALHAAGRDALGLARQLAANTSQSILIRKASIACIGKYGDSSDLTDLKNLTDESTRLAQAADPATSQIRERIANPNKPAYISF